MFDIGWSELLLIGIVALIVVGPKDLPRMFNALGRFTAKAKSMGREFQRAMDDAAKDSGMAETAKDLRTIASKKNLGLDKIEEAASKFEKWDPVKESRAKAAPAGSETAKLAERRSAEAQERKAAAAPSAKSENTQAKPKKAAGNTAGASSKKAAAPKKKPTRSRKTKPEAEKE